jgi:spermidine synthase
MNEGSGDAGHRVGLLYLLATVSGAAALIYQVAWSNLLSLTFGSSTLAVSAVVAGFMGGMGVGAWRWHRVANRVGAPLRAYAWLEVGIALSTALFTRGFTRLPHLYAGTAGAIEPGLGLDLLRIASVLVLLAVPAAFMGATYPALCMALIRTRHQVDRHLGVIYGLNTVGAAVGALVAGFVLMEHLGATGAIWLANGLNLAVAAAAWRASSAPEAPQAGVASIRDEPIPTRLPYLLTGVVLFGAGFTTLGYEILWFRALRYLLGNATYALSAALVLFLLGLGLGALFYRPAVRSGHAERNLGLAQLGVAVLALLVMTAELQILRIPELRESLSIFSAQMQARSWVWRLGVSAGVATALMLPATLLMGLAFPLASRLYLGSVQRVGARVGSAYLISNLGSVSGAVAAAVAILPAFGTLGGTSALALVNLTLGLAVVLWVDRRPVALGLAAATSAACIAIALALPQRLPFVGEPELVKAAPRLVYEEESELGTVQVRLGPRGEGAMVIDGVLISAGSRIQPQIYRKQLFLADLPMVLDPGIRNVLTVGIASCSTLAALARHDLEEIDGVEINPAVMRASTLFRDCRVMSDPRVDVVVEDAVHYLLRSPKRWDAIVSDGKQNKDFSGNAKILSEEFYRFSAARLSKCGLFAQWIPLSNDPESFEITLRTFLRVFPEVELFLEPPGSIYMVGSRCPVSGREPMSQERYAELGVGKRLALGAYEYPRVQDLLSLWITGATQLEGRLPDGPTNSWDRMPIAFLSYRARTSLRRAAAENVALLLESRKEGEASPFEAPGSPEARSRPLTQRGLLAILRGDESEALRLLRRAERENPDDVLARWGVQFVSNNTLELL